MSDIVLRSYNSKPEEIAFHIKEILKANYQYYSGLRVRCVTIERESDGSWHNALCIIHAFPKELGSEKQKSRRYKNVHLLEGWLKEGDLLDLVDEVSKRSITVDGKQITLSQHTQLNQFECQPSGNDYSTYPGFLYRTSGYSGDVPIPYEPLLNYDLPFYLNVYAAIHDWTQIRHFHESGDTRVGSLLIFLPECQMRFGSFRNMTNCLEVAIEPENQLIPGLCVKGGWQYAGITSNFEAAVTKATISLEVPSQAELFEIYLIGSNGRVYDFRRETRLRSNSNNRVLQTLSSNQTVKDTVEDKVRNSIKLGEGENIEFKTFIHPGN